MASGTKLPFNQVSYEELTIASGQTTSAAIDLGEYTLIGIDIPSNFDGTTLTLLHSTTSGGTYNSVQIDHTSASAFTITTAASRYVPLSNLAIPAGLRFVKLVAGTSQSTSDTVFKLALRKI